MSTVKIGWAKREISTTEPVSVPGQMYLRISEGIHDPLYVTALCVDGGEGQDKIIFLSCDIVTPWVGILQPIRDKLKERRPEIPEEGFILNVTHTHSSISLSGSATKTPDGADMFPGDKSREIFCELAAQAIIEAWDTRAEGGIGYGYGYAVIGHSRRVVYFKDQKLARNAEKSRDFMTPSGYGVMYGNTNDPLFSHYEAGADHFMNLMFTFDAAQKLTGIVVNVPCPSQLSEHFTKLSADYWHDVRTLVAKEFGPDVFVLPQCAAAGDVSPRVLHYKQAQARRMRLKYDLPYEDKLVKRNNEHEYNKVMGERYDIAERIVEGVKEVYAWAKKDIQTEVAVRHKVTQMALERRKITEEEKAWCEENLELLKDMAPKAEEMTPEEYRMAITNHQSKVNRNRGGLERYEDVKKNPTLNMQSHTVQIGDIAFATIRFETYIDFMHRLQARSPFIQTFVIQMAGTEGGNYLATHRGAEAKGYSASMFCNMVSADGGHQWVENQLAVLNEMKAEDEA